MEYDAEIGEGPQAKQDADQKWTRPALPAINPKKDALVFQQIDIDHYTGKVYSGMPGAQKGPVPIFRMYGVTMEGNSVCAHVHGFSPYLYVTAPEKFQKSHLYEFQKKLDAVVMKDMKSNRENVEEAILQVEIVQRQSIQFYTGEDKRNFLKITVALPRLLAAVKRLLEREVIMQEVDFQDCRCYESNIDFDIRFMVDTKVVGCSWIEIPAGNWNRRTSDGNFPIESRCQLEIDVAFDKFIAHEPEGEWSKVAPFRILSFDIECAGRKGIFPEPEIDPVIQIANMVMYQGEKEPFIRNVFTLNTCGSIIGSQVLSYPKEQDLLRAWSEFVRECDPDIITGYNINNFDVPYLINRAKQLKVNDFVYLGRIINIKSVIKDSVLQSKQMGRRENKQVNFEGRVPFDLLFVLLRDYKLRSYTLNAVSYHFLQAQKEDVHHSIITGKRRSPDFKLILI